MLGVGAGYQPYEFPPSFELAAAAGGHAGAA